MTLSDGILQNQGTLSRASSPGVVVGLHGSRKRALTVYGTGKVANLWDIPLSTTAAETVTVRIVGERSGLDVTVSATFVGTTDATNRGVLLAALQASALAGVAGTFASEGASNIEFTGRDDEQFTITATGDGIAPAETTAPASSPLMTYGRFYTLGAQTGTVVPVRAATAITAIKGGEVTYTMTYEAAKVGTWALSLRSPDGQVIRASGSSIATGGNLAAFRTAVKASLDTELDGTGATVVNDATTDLIVTFPVGWEIITATGSGTDGSDVNPSEPTAGSAPPDVAMIENDGTDSLSEAGVLPTGRRGDRSPVAVVGGVDVSVTYPGASITTGSRVWIETAAGANNGRPYTTSTPSRFRHPHARWIAQDGAIPTLAYIALEG